MQENLEKAEFLKEVLCIELNKLNLLLAEQVLLMISAMLVSRSWESKKSVISFFFQNVTVNFRQPFDEGNICLTGVGWV